MKHLYRKFILQQSIFIHILNFLTMKILKNLAIVALLSTIALSCQNSSPAPQTVVAPPKIVAPTVLANLNSPIVGIQLSNALGLQVMQVQNSVFSQNYKTALDLSNFADGFYVLTVVYENGFSESKKVMIQKGTIAN